VYNMKNIMDKFLSTKKRYIHRVYMIKEKKFFPFEVNKMEISDTNGK